MHGDLVSYFSIHTDQASSFGGCMAQASYLDTGRRLASFLAKKSRFVTTSKLEVVTKRVRDRHKAGGWAAHCPNSAQPALGRWGAGGWSILTGSQRAAAGAIDQFTSRS